MGFFDKIKKAVLGEKKVEETPKEEIVEELEQSIEEIDKEDGLETKEAVVVEESKEDVTVEEIIDS